LDKIRILDLLVILSLGIWARFGYSQNVSPMEIPRGCHEFFIRLQAIKMDLAFSEINKRKGSLIERSVTNTVYLLGAQWPRPATITFSKRYHKGGVSDYVASPHDNTIIWYTPLPLKDLWRKTPSIPPPTIDVLIHEVTHLFFKERMELDFPPLKQYLKQWENRSSLSNAEQALLSRQFAKLKGLFLPYSELFSDLVTVLSLGDPSVIHDRLVKLGIGHRAEGRNFATYLDPKRWHVTDGSRLLGPVRGFIWKNYRGRLHTIAGRRLVVEGVYQAILERINQQYKENRLPKDFVEESNRELIRSIRKHLD